jgi:hypothetical protein
MSRERFTQRGWTVEESDVSIVAVSPQGARHLICMKGELLPIITAQGITFCDVITDAYDDAEKQGLFPEPVAVVTHTLASASVATQDTEVIR